MAEDPNSDPDGSAWQLTDELDLHTFAPSEVKNLVWDYLDECVGRGYQTVRIIHGKGVGNLRRIVHAQLDRHPNVADYSLGDLGSGSWGATLVVLRSRDE